MTKSFEFKCKVCGYNVSYNLAKPFNGMQSDYALRAKKDKICVGCQTGTSPESRKGNNMKTLIINIKADEEGFEEKAIETVRMIVKRLQEGINKMGGNFKDTEFSFDVLDLNEKEE